MSKSTFWGLALATVIAGGAVAASTMAPALTREDGEETKVVYTLDPETGAIVNDLQTITITFEDKNVQVNGRLEPNAIVLTNTETDEEYYCGDPLQLDRVVDGVAYQLNFLTQVEGADGNIEEKLLPINTPGTYTLSISGRTFITGDEVVDAEGNVGLKNIVSVQPIEAAYTVKEAAPAIAYTLEPENEAIVNDLQTITISFSNKNVQPNDKMVDGAIVLKDENGEEYYCNGPVRLDRTAEGVAYQLNFLTQVEDAEGNIEEKLEAINKPGTYTLTIAASTFISGDEVEGDEGVTLENVVAVEAINATYTVVEAAPAVAYTLEPENEAIVNDLKSITIHFAEKTVEVNDKMAHNAIVLTAENGDEYYCDAPVRLDRVAEGIAYQLNFLTQVENENGVEDVLEPITTPGTYTLTILKGTFINNDDALENVVAVEAINATYTVVEAAPAVAYTLDPENEAIVNDLQTITIYFDEKNVLVNDKMETTAIVLKDENGNEYYCDAPVRLDRVASGVAYQLNFLTQVENAEGNIEEKLEAINTPGTYTLSIAKGSFIKADEVEDANGNIALENVVAVEAIDATYTVVAAAPEVTYTLDPENEAIVNDIKTITINFENKNVQLNERMELTAIVLTDEAGKEYYCDAPVRLDRVASGVAYQLNFMTEVENENGVENVLEPITTPGVYTLSILKGTFICGDEVEGDEGVTLENVVPVQAINATYTVVEAAPAVAYTLEPENEAIVNDLQTITITFADKNVQLNSRVELNAIVLTAENGEEYYCDAPVRLDRVDEGVAYQLNFLTQVETEEGFENVLEPITTPGAYTLTILANTFITGDEVEGEEGVTLENVVPVEAINATYTVVEAAPEVAYSLEPENEAIVNDLQSIVITFADKEVQVNERMEGSAIVLKAENGEEYYCDAPVRLDREAEGVAYQLNFLTQVEDAEGNLENVLEPITTPGAYTLTIMKGAFLAAENVAVQAIEATYTVAEAAPAVAYTLNPEDGAIVNDIQTVTISFEDKNVQLNSRMELNAIVLTDENGEEYYCDEPVRLDRVASGVAYQLNFMTVVENEGGMESVLEPITTPGAYTLTILANTFITGEEVEDAEGNVTLENVVPVQAINAAYTVVEAPAEVTYTLDPEDGATVSDLQTITINFEDKNVQLNDKMEFNAIILTADNGEEYYCDAPVRLDRVASGVAYQLNFTTIVETESGMDSVLEPITTPGTYTLTILANTFITGEEVEDENGVVTLENVAPVQAIYATYTISAASGVSAIFGEDAAEFDVYTVNGIQVLKKADKNAVNNLPAGLYIINGKKVLVK